VLFVTRRTPRLRDGDAEIPISPLLDGGLLAPLRHEICRELLQTVHERFPGEFLGMNDQGIAPQLELSRNFDSVTIPAHREPCFLCSHEGTLLRFHMYIPDDIRVCRMSQWIVQRSMLASKWEQQGPAGLSCLVEPDRADEPAQLSRVSPVSLGYRAGTRVVDFIVAAVYSLLDCCGSSRVWENHFGTAELRWPARLEHARSVWLSRLSGLFGVSRLFG
jgi:hypothetical protein